jgi:peptidoglycan hydrolase-like protein with peptidoglycan-binding domain/tetratricopeptide (TPR) repeat protein
MSRSDWAWSESSAALGAVGRVWKRSGCEVRVDLGGWLRFGWLSATRCLVMLMAAGLVWLGAVAAPALAASSSGSLPGAGGQRVGGGVLGVGSGCAGGSARVRGVQRRLVEVGFSPGPVDGCYGRWTEAAVARFQAARGLRVDGIVGRFTLAALRGRAIVLFPGAGYTAQGSARVRALQRRLTRAGFSSGPIDGRYGPRTERAVARFQAGHGLRVDGIAGPRTFAALRNAQAVRGRPHGGSQANQPSARARARGRSQGNQPSARARAHGRSQASRASARARAHGGSRGNQPVRSRRGALAPVHQRSRPRNGSGWFSAALLVAVVLLGLAAAGVGAWTIRRRGRVGAGAPAAARQASRSVAGPERGAMAREAAYREADARGDAAAAWELGGLLEQRGDLAGAEAAYRRADGRGDVNAAFNLGGLLAERGDLPGAEAAYRRADERGDAGAASNLGVLLERRGELAGAERAYRRADERGDANGAFGLGGRLAQRGDLAGAIAAYRRAEQRGDPRAALNVGVLLEHAGDLAGAEAAYRRAGERGDAHAMFNHALLLEKQGLLDAARPVYEQARRLGDPEIAEQARVRARELTRRASQTTANTTGGRS